MIVESLLTTLSETGLMHLAPMGPRVHPDGKHMTLRPFRTSTSYDNLRLHGEGVIHITDDVLMMARAAVGQAGFPAHHPAERIKGFILSEACRYHEFVVESIDDTDERVSIEVKLVHSVTLRDFFGFNRGKHAVLEAAILMTRLHLIPRMEIITEMQKLHRWVEKTGGPQEFEAWDFLTNWLETH
jgi:uncharacterized protein